jgi:hypothetical protein
MAAAPAVEDEDIETLALSAGHKFLDLIARGGDTRWKATSPATRCAAVWD